MRQKLLVSLIVLSIAQVGCASSQSATQAFLQSEINSLAMRCYQSKEGERLILGQSAVWSACLRWASQSARSAGS